MNVVVLYLVLLKATLLSFSGFGSLPLVRDDLVVRRAVLTDDQLNRAVVVARTTPGPMGVYLVSVGYQAAGVNGAVAGWLAMATPAMLVLPLLFASVRLANSRRAVGAINGLVLASAVLLVLSSVPLGVDLWTRLQHLLP